MSFSVASRPSWLLLLVWLFIWTWSASNDRSSSIFVNAQQNGLPPCVATCAQGAASTVGCRGLDLVCICNSASFFEVAEGCMSTNCTALDEAQGVQFFDNVCEAAVSTTLPPISIPTAPPVTTTQTVPFPTTVTATATATTTRINSNPPPPQSSANAPSPTVTVTQSNSPPSNPAAPSSAPLNSDSQPPPAFSPSNSDHGDNGTKLPASVSASATAPSGSVTVVPGATSTMTFTQALPSATPTGEIGGAIGVRVGVWVGVVGVVLGVVMVL